MSPLTLGTRIGAGEPSRTILVEPHTGAGRGQVDRHLEAVTGNRDRDRVAGGDDMAPRFTGTILGVRQWLVPQSVDDLKPLRTLKARTPSWETDGSPTQARCFSSEGESHEPPGTRCECGLRAYHPWSVPPWYLRSGDKAANQDRYLTGVVEAWGRIELYPEGFRAEFAHPVALVLPPAFSSNDIARTALVDLCDRAAAELLDPEQDVSLDEQQHQLGDDDADQQLTRTVLGTWFERNRSSTARDILDDLLPPR